MQPKEPMARRVAGQKVQLVLIQKKKNPTKAMGILKTQPNPKKLKKEKRKEKRKKKKKLI